LIETLLLEGGEYYLLERHLERITASARYFGFACDEELLRAALDRVRLAHTEGHWKVRLLCGDDATVTTSADEVEMDAEKVYRVAFAERPVDSRDVMLFHKTTDRRAYEDELRRRADVDDLLFWNEHGEVTESSIANLVLIAEGRKWTPPRRSGLLRGTFAAELIHAGELRERRITKQELSEARSFYLVNSVRKWMRAVLVA
jgi:para-aminobenzoate synthetase/4-amino-4-deoxychorismate lyase